MNREGSSRDSSRPGKGRDQGLLEGPGEAIPRGEPKATCASCFQGAKGEVTRGVQGYARLRRGHRWEELPRNLDVTSPLLPWG